MVKLPSIKMSNFNITGTSESAFYTFKNLIVREWFGNLSLFHLLFIAFFFSPQVCFGYLNFLFSCIGVSLFKSVAHFSIWALECENFYL